MKISWVLLLLTVLMVTGCNKDESDVREGLGVSTPTTSGGVGGGGNPMNPKILRVVDENGQAVENYQLSINNSISVRAALFDLNNQFITYAPASWNLFGSTVMNTNFPSTNLTVDPIDSSKAILTPTTIGVASIGITYAGLDGTVIVRSDRTGNIFISSTQEVFALNVKSGNSQSGMVDTELQFPLEVIARDQYGQSIAGTTLEISISQGNGSIVSGTQVLTDSDGVASFRVKVGTVSGVGNNIFRVRSVSKPGLSPVYFTASVTPGEVDHLKFTVEPAHAYQGVPFGEQPVIDVMDVFGNKVDVSGTITLTKAQGSGNLTGTTSTPVTSGRAIFTNLSWDTYEANVKLLATFGTRTQESVVFSVGQSLPGACLLNDNQFRTQEGGCKDQASGLIWSSSSGARMSWNNSIWDSQFTGSSIPDVDDYGRTNDYAEGEVSHFPSNAPSSYCKNLFQGGYSDWRLPTSAELIAAYSRSAANYLRSVVNETYISSNSQNNSNGAVSVNLTTGATVNLHVNNDTRYVFCVRGGNRATTKPSKIVIESVPVFTRGGVTTEPLVVQIKNDANQTVNLGGITLTLSSSNGSVSTGATAITDRTGKANFNGIILSESGNLTLTVSYNGGGLYSLSPATQVVNVKSFIQYCTTEDTLFATAEGGCKDLSTGLVWSSASPGLMKWNAATWDAFGPGAPLPDDGDYGRTNDYGSDCAVGWDGNYCDRAGSTAPIGSGYCKELIEGGYSDWRLPTTGELAILAPYRTRLQGLVGKSFWSSNKINSSSGVATFNGSTGESTTSVALNDRSVICVRGNRKPGNVIKVTQNPSMIIQSGLSNTIPLKIQITDEDGGSVFAEKIFSISSPTLTVGGTNTFSTNYLGVGEVSAFTVTGPAGNHDLVISSPGFQPHSISIRVIPFKQYCAVEDGLFQTVDGGCKDMTSGLVWSSVSSSSMSWHDAIWDASVPGATQPDADDFGRTNDYSNNCSDYCDTTSTAYCKSLTESGYTDWRLPSSGELGTLVSSVNRIPGLGSLSVYSSSYSGSLWISAFNSSTGVAFSQHVSWGGLNVICVRGNRQNGNLISFSQAPTVIAPNSTSFIPFILQVKDVLGNDVYAEKLMTISGSPGLTLSGNLTFLTNKLGSGKTNSFSVSGSDGMHSLIFSGPGIDPRSIPIEVRATAGKMFCSPEGDGFISQNGGCHDTSTGLVWSTLSNVVMTWHQAVWDSTLSGNAQPDIHDGTRVDDYAIPPIAGERDSSTANYCHSLNEGGYQDWRLPTEGELFTLYTREGKNYLYPRIDSQFLWSSNVANANQWARKVNINTGSNDWSGKGDQYKVLCVRDNP